MQVNLNIKYVHIMSKLKSKRELVISYNIYNPFKNRVMLTDDKEMNYKK